MSRYIKNGGFGGVLWDDLRFPAQALNPAGAVNDADIDTADTTFIGTLLFDAGSTEIIAGVAQMPHAWIEGSTISPHIHWAPTDATAGNVVWQFDYDIAAPNGTFSGSYTTSSITEAAGGSANGHQLAGFADIDMTGYTLSTIILWRISRIGGDASDTYGADARLFEFDIHYQLQSGAEGSRQEFIK